MAVMFLVPAAAFHINAVDLEPSSVVPPGSQLSIVVEGTNQQQVTAGIATVTVWYYGVRVLTASDTLCPQAAAIAAASSQSVSHRKLMVQRDNLSANSSSRQKYVWLGWQHNNSRADNDDATCTLAAGPLHMTHTATLPGFAPRGSYSMRLAAADMLTGQQIMCLDVWFKVG